MKTPSQTNRGAALIITLGVLAIVLLLVMGFAISMRTEQIASRTFQQGSVARHMALAAVEEAIFLIRTNTYTLTADLTYVTQPGRIVSDLSPHDRLFSVSGAGTVNLNADNRIINANPVYPNPDNRRIEVNWINVCSNGLASGAPLIGRYAYWVDDEASKIDINSACTRNNILGASPRDVDLTLITGIGPATASNILNYATTNGFPSLEHLKLIPNISVALFESNKFYLTAHSVDANLTPWGTRRFNLNSSFTEWKNEINANCANTLAHPGLISWFGSTFANKYGGNPNIIRQIMANMADFRFRADNLDCMGAQAGDLDAGGLGWSQVPMWYHGLRLSPYLNEIGVRATYWRPAGGNELQCKLWILVELVNPYPVSWGNGYQIIVDLDKLVFRVTGYGNDYYTGYNPGWVWNGTPNWATMHFQRSQTNTLSTAIPPNSYQVVALPVWVGLNEGNVNAWVDQVYVRIAKVRLLGTAGNNNSIRDWAITPDFDTRNCSGGNHFCFLDTDGQAGNAPIVYVADGSQPGSDNNQVQGIAKNDPRVRRFTAWTPPGSGNQLPWSPVGYDIGGSPATIGAQNSIVNFQCGTGLPGVPNDPDPTSMTGIGVTNHPSFYMKATTSDVLYESPGELGYIHTGLQWRTLRLQPRPSAEASANHIPDWAVLDIFSTTNGPVRGRININGVVTNLYTGNPNWRDRILPIRAAIPPNWHTFGAGPNTDADRVATNIYNQVWASASTWGSARTNAPNYFTPGFYNMIGELCEIDRVATNFSGATNDFLREARIRSFANLFTVRSDQFTIWAVGQAIQDVNNNGVFDAGTDLILGETRAQAVVERFDGADGQFGVGTDTPAYRLVYFRYLTD
ncbi:MAG: hypothetical protein RMM51_09735 [Verrucomicrobiae bacterium]|nr:hypothetical protein [Verrucomicrobiae bacterium]